MNNFLPLFLALTENDKRFLIALLLVVILVFVIIGVLGSVVYRVMKWQSKKMDTLIHDVVYYKVITERNHLVKYGRIKNWSLFFKQAYIPVLILLVSNIFLIIYEACNNWSYNPFSVENGFGSLFFTFKWGDTVTWFIFAFRTLEVVHTPTFNINNWAGYLYCPALIVGACWYLVAVQSLISRTIRLFKLSRSVFEKSLEGYNQTTGFAQQNNQQQNSETSVPPNSNQN